jgi:hypothetical protein
MDLSDLFKLLIPAVFLVFWALNQLFGREDAAAGRTAPPGPRPGGLPPAPRTRSPERQPTASDWSGGRTFDIPPRPTTTATTTLPPEEVLVIGGEPRRPGSARGRTQAGGRRGGRGKGPAPPQAGESAAPRSLVEPLVQSLAISPLTPTPTPAAPESPAFAPTWTAQSLLEMAQSLRSPERLREALLVSEILGPPKARRAPWRR